LKGQDVIKVLGNAEKESVEITWLNIKNTTNMILCYDQRIEKIGYIFR
jgi:hypothetical protein